MTDTTEMTGTAETAGLTFNHDMPEGAVYVTILAAETDRAHDHTGLGRVQVHTDPDPTCHEPHGFVKIRGRKYRIDKSYRRLADDAGPDLDGNPRIWQPEPSNGYLEGYRNEHLVRVGLDSRARDRLDEIVAEVLGLFEKSQPQWRRESGRQAWMDIRERHVYDAELARKSLREAEAAIAEIDGKLAAFL